VVEVFAVALGGALGSVLRYWSNQWVYLIAGRGFPWGTLFVNVLGSLLIGLLFAFFAGRPAPPIWRAFLLIGVLGGFTTFSTFSIETALLLERGETGRALANALGSVIACVGAAYSGYVLARLWLNQGT
jgi:CrcB protein